MPHKSRKKMGFSVSHLHKRKEPHALMFLAQKTSFWIAALCLIAFVAGNMVGKHGWYVFWKSVLGGDAEIAYTGTVSPVEFVPDYEIWSKYGGDASVHTYRQVPKEALRRLPRYHAAKMRKTTTKHGHGNSVYSVGHLGSYDTGAEASGSHPGVDIRVPIGTPVRSVMNGIVESVNQDVWGFGNYIVIKHPNVPDPSNPKATTTLYSNYAHLNAQYVEKGDIVQKGTHIADSGNTGNTSGPHLHFQIDRDTAPWHPYWPFSSSEARREGLSITQAVNKGLFQSRGYIYTVHPMLYVQANYSVVEPTAVRNAVAVRSTTPTTARETTQQRRARIRAERLSRIQARRDERVRLRLARRRERSDRVALRAPVVTSTETVATVGLPEEVRTIDNHHVTNILIQHDGSFGRGEEHIHLTLLDENGNTVKHPLGETAFTLTTGFGEATFRPQSFKASEFRDGELIVKMKPKGKRTIVLQVQPFGTLSKPMVYGRRR